MTNANFLRSYAKVLTAVERDDIRDASVRVTDHVLEAVCSFETQYTAASETARRELFEGTMLPSYLPTRFAHLYTPVFVKSFAVAVISVGLKMAVGGELVLASVAEEMAMAAILEHANDAVEIAESTTTCNGDRVDDFAEGVFEDQDFRLLFSEEYDGIETSPVAAEMRMANVRFEEWFQPFRDDTPVHPYVVDDDASQTGDA